MKRLSIAIALTIGVLAVYALRLDDIGGLSQDDAYYTVLAQSLAHGQGYALASSATAPILPAFPPGFALLLAPVFAIVPRYPENLMWLKVISIAAMIGVGLLTFHYLHRYRDAGRDRAATIAALTALTPGFVFLATSNVMSECAFTLALMGSAVLLERAADDRSHSRRDIILAALVTTTTWLIRGAGLVLVLGALLYVLWRRGWRAAAGFLIVCAISYAPWALYSATHSPTQAERAAHGGDIVHAYGSPMAARAGERDVTILDVGRRASANALNLFGRDIGALVFPAGFRGADESGLEVFLLAGSTGLSAGSMGIGPLPVATSLVIAFFVITGAFVAASRRVGVAEIFCALTILMLIVVPSRAVYRYALPLAPFVIAYFLLGVESAAAWLRAGAGPPAFRIASGSLLALLMIEHGQYIGLKAMGPSPPFIRDAREVRLVTDYINAHLPVDAPVVSTNPGLVYLLTGRKAVAYVDPVVNLERWKSAGIRYAVALHVVPGPSQSTGRMLFKSPRLKLWVLEMTDSGHDRN